MDVATITTDAIDIFIETAKEQIENKKNSDLYNMLDKLMSQDKYELIKETLLPKDYNFIVTPKEIDELIENMSSIVARGINKSLQ